MDLAYLRNPEILSPNLISTVCDEPTAIQADETSSISDNDNDGAGAFTMEGNEKELHNKNPSVFEFESTYGFISDRISCPNIMFDKSDLETVISLKSWVIDNVLSSFLMLLNQSTVFSVDTAFETM